MSSDHTEAATITPEANPSSAFCSLTGISPFIRNTKAEPSIVPSSGISNPIVSVVVVIIIYSYQLCETSIIFFLALK